MRIRSAMARRRTKRSDEEAAANTSAVRFAHLQANDAVVDGGGEELGNLLDNVAVLRRVEPPGRDNSAE